jgi:hypothetical protein
MRKATQILTRCTEQEIEAKSVEGAETEEDLITYGWVRGVL